MPGAPWQEITPGKMKRTVKNTNSEIKSKSAPSGGLLFNLLCDTANEYDAMIQAQEQPPTKPGSLVGTQYEPGSLFSPAADHLFEHKQFPADVSRGPSWTNDIELEPKKERKHAYSYT
jgi:hypothetical protein